MAGENLAWFLVAKGAEEHAFLEAQAVVRRFRDAATKLTDWPRAQFWYRKSDGTRTGGMPDERTPSTIDIDDVPSIQQVREATQKWSAADASLQQAWRNLTREEQEGLGTGILPRR